MIKKKTFIPLLFTIMMGCAYSFVGSKLTKEVKTYSFFVENKTTVLNNDSQSDFCDLLKKMIQRAYNRLAYVNQNGDLQFDIIIEKVENSTNSISSIDGSEGSSSQKITMELEVSYKNNITGESFEKKKFSDHEDIDEDIDFDSQINKYITKVSEKIIQQIIDETVNDW